MEEVGFFVRNNSEYIKNDNFVGFNLIFFVFDFFLLSSLFLILTSCTVKTILNRFFFKFKATRSYDKASETRICAQPHPTFLDTAAKEGTLYYATKEGTLYYTRVSYTADRGGGCSRSSGY